MFFIDQLRRVMKPGCNACIHIQQLLAYKNQHGYMGRRDFRGAVVDLFRAGGFHHTGEFTIAKDPQVMANQMHLHSLQFKTGHSRTSTMLMPCPNDYVLIFQVPGETPNKVRCLKHAKNPAGWYSQEEWIRDACGVWSDILMTDVLDTDAGRESKTEKHVCPLQLSVIARLVRLYTNPIAIQPDVTVLDPFMGIGSTAYVCLGGKTRDGRVEGPRNVVGFELKESYHKAALHYTGRAMADLGAAEGNIIRPRTFFDLIDPEPGTMDDPEPTPIPEAVVDGNSQDGNPDPPEPDPKPAKPRRSRKPREAPSALADAARAMFPPPGEGPVPDNSRVVWTDRDGSEWHGLHRFTMGDLASITLDEVSPGVPVARFLRVDPATLRAEATESMEVAS